MHRPLIQKKYGCIIVFEYACFIAIPKLKLKILSSYDTLICLGLMLLLSRVKLMRAILFILGTKVSLVYLHISLAKS